jgi:hypothetical protein
MLLYIINLEERTMDAEGGPLDRITVNVSSPDQQISVRLSKVDQVELTFRRGTYRRYDELSLGRQLGQLATSTWLESRRAYRQALYQETGIKISGDERPGSPKLAEYRRAQADLAVSGISPGEWVRVASRGLVRWEVTVSDGTCARLTEAEFVSEAGGAVQSLLKDYYEKSADLQERLFGLRRSERNTGERA